MLLERLAGEFSGCGCVTAHPEVTPERCNVRVGDNTATGGLARSRAPISNPLTCVLVTGSILKSILVEGIMSVLANIKTREVVDEDLVAK